MRSTNTNFDTKHDLDYKTPLSLVHFDGEVIDYCNYLPIVPTKEDLTEYTEYEDSSKDPFNVTPDSVVVTDLSRDEDAHIYDDMGVGFFNGDFTHYQKVKITASDADGLVPVWSLMNVVDSVRPVQVANGDFLTVYLNYNAVNFKIFLYECNGGSIQTDDINISLSTDYYLKIIRRESVGANGTLYCYVYTDSAMANLLGTLSLALGSKNDFRYIYAVNSYDDGNTYKMSAVVSDLRIREYKKYLASISSLSRKVMPEEGKSSISGITVRILDKDDEITSLISTDSNYFHRKKTTVKVGYAGLSEEEMLTIFVGWVTGLKLSSGGLVYEFSITDPTKWMQRKVFRNASDTSPVTINGNPLNILLSILMSTGNADSSAASDYDYLAAANGLGIDEDTIKVSAIEELRDSWYPGPSHYMSFTIKKRIKAKDFFEQEIFKPLNLYPAIDGQGRFYVRRFMPPLPTVHSIQSFDEDNIIGLPGWDSNLATLVNELEFNYNWNTSTRVFDNEILYINSTSINNRGPGKKTITIKSKGLHTSLSPGSLTLDVGNIIARRKSVVFNRFSIPPLKLSAKTFFDRWLSEVGDIVPITHSRLPDIESGTRGLDESRMEIVSENIDFKSGQVSLRFLDTGFDKSQYAVVSPSMVVISGASSTQFTVSVADAIKYSNFTAPEVKVMNANGIIKAASITILTVNTSTGVITCDSIGETPAAGWLIAFSSYDNCTIKQKLYWFLSSLPHRTVLLLHMDGTDGSTDFIDDGINSHIVTAQDNAQIDTARVKFGTGALLCDGASDYLSIADHADWAFGTGALTIDFWIWFNALPTDGGSASGILQQNVDTGHRHVISFINIGGVYGLSWVCRNDNGGTTYIINKVFGPISITTGAWFHFALIRGWGGSANTWAATMSGIVIDTDSQSGTMPNFAAPLFIGVADGSYLDGWIDEFRIVKGTAMWTANFTPSTAPYPTLDPDDYYLGAVDDDEHLIIP